MFAVAFLVRPLGAVLGAKWADRAGRRRPLLVAWLAMSLATAAIGLLPSWQTAGAITIAALMMMRVLQGVSAGAELVVSVAYLVELAPPGRRGGWGGVHMATNALGFAGGSATVATVSRMLSNEALTSWGWRLPFLAALPLGAAAFVLRWRLMEAPEYLALADDAAAVWNAPGKALRPERATAGRGFLLAGGFMASFTLWFVYLPSHLSSAGVLPLTSALAGATAGLIALAAAAVAWGRLSDLLAESFSPAMRAVGIAMTAGMASAFVGATAPLVADLLVDLDPGLLPGYAIIWLGLAGWATMGLPARLGASRSAARTSPGDPRPHPAPPSP